ncbi:MAG: DUF2000 domain-containing protein [Marmoricola sp.]
MNTMTEESKIGFAREHIDQSASTRDVPYKWIVVVDSSLPAGRAVNAAVCVASATMGRTRGILGDDAIDSDGAVHPGLPWIGCTVLGAEAAKLAEVRAKAAVAPGVVLVDMPTQAQHTRVYEDYLFAVSSTRGPDLSYYAVSVFGPRKTIDKIAKGLSLLS